jgi:hypothetical protein
VSNLEPVNTRWLLLKNDAVQKCGAEWKNVVGKLVREIVVDVRVASTQFDTGHDIEVQ